MSGTSYVPRNEVDEPSSSCVHKDYRGNIASFRRETLQFTLQPRIVVSALIAQSLHDQSIVVPSASEST